MNLKSMMFIVGIETVGVTETGGSHGETSGVPSVRYLDGFGGEWSEDFRGREVVEKTEVVVTWWTRACSGVWVGREER